jgi:hypothetical protein
MKVQQRGRFEDDRRTDQPPWAHEHGTQAGDHTLGGTPEWATVFAID